MSPPGPHLVLGTGRAGLAAIRALRETGAPVLAWDEFDGETTRARVDALARDGVELVLGTWDPALLRKTPLSAVVKSPGVPLDAQPVRDALAAGLDVVDELEIGVRRTRRELVAVTGTDGKSTVASLLAAALGPEGEPAPVTGNTEFGPPLSAVPAEGGRVVVEASSYQLAFTAPAFARLAVLTNITEEHLHRHGSLAAYANAKRRAFLDGDGHGVPLAVVGVDDAPGRQLAADLKAAGATVVTVGGGATDYTAMEVRSELDGAEVRAGTPAGPLTLRLRLPGAHNARNALAALAACDLLGVERGHAVSALEAFGGVPGRWEWIGRGDPCDAIVDFAHTPAALRAVLTTVREVVERRGGGARCHLVLSASGSTTPHKRGPLGAVGRALADRVIVTDAGFGGQPREEVFAEILAGAEGVPGPALEVVPDRRDAIRAALAGARPGDVVLVNDRGARPRWITDPAGGGFPWDDREVVAEEHARLRR